MSILIRILLNILLVWLVAKILPADFVLTGGLPAFIILGLVISVLNVIVKPILKIITFPLKLLTNLVWSIVVNILFLKITEVVVTSFQSPSVMLDIRGGIVGWIAVAGLFAVLNWLLHSLPFSARNS